MTDRAAGGRAIQIHSGFDLKAERVKVQRARASRVTEWHVMTSLRFYSGQDLFALHDPSSMIAAVDAAIRASDEVTVPNRLHIDSGSSVLLVMPAAYAGNTLVKCISVAENNPAKGLPLIHGLAILSDAATGIPLALFDAAQLTGLRTGALAAVALGALSDPDLDRIGIVGVGEQAYWTAIHAAASRPLREICCVSRSKASFERFRKRIELDLPAISVIRCPDAFSLLERTTHIVTATTSDAPVLPDDEDILRGKAFISIGSFKRSSQELPDAAYRLARRVVVDSPHAAYEVGDLITPVARGILQPSDIISAADFLAGRHTELEQTRIFKSVGFAAFDLFAAADIHRRNSQSLIGREIIK